jgi:transposase
MRKEPPLPQDVWDKLAPDAQAAVLLLVERYEQTSARLEHQIAELKAQLAQLQTRLNQNSQNSSRPPSTDPPGLKRSPPRQPSGRKRGAQPGHRRHERTLVPPHQVQQTVLCKPTACRRCGTALEGTDSEPLRHQVTELPPIEPHVTEYQLHRLVCPHCGTSTCGPLPSGVPTGHFGPRLQSVLALLSGAYRLSKRMVERLGGDLLGIEICTGEICALEQASAAALHAPVAEAREYVRQQPSAGMDETGWRENRRRAWLWVAVTAWVTVFAIRLSRGAKVAREMLGDSFDGLLTSDRWSGYHWITLLRRQVCWAHLRREFQAMIDRGTAGGPAIGKRLLGHSDALFGWWHRVRDSTLSRATFHDYVMRRLRGAFRQDLEAGTRCRCSKTAATCRELLRVEPALWTFVRRAGVEPTNNAAERVLRHAVLWRKSSYGTDSQAGSHFVENILTVVASCRQQGRNVLDYLTRCCEAALAGDPAPSLLPTRAPDQPALKAA